MEINFEQNNQFFQWLFDRDDIEIESTVDFTLCANHYDPNIYYPKELGDFFRTQAMKRLSRILQLSKFIDCDNNTYHTRFEHSMGVYNQKKNIILNLYKNPEFRNYIEENNLKKYLIAELIKSAGHDIGHLPLSHTLEISVIGKRDFHEDIGRRILLENEEILAVLTQIDKLSKYNNLPDEPNLYQALQTVLNTDVFGFDLIDEGNYDIDRFDYITRDLFYRGQQTSLNFEPFTIQKIEIDGHEKTAPVFDINSVPAIEDFLNLRLQAYKESYFHPIDQIRDSSIAIGANKLIESNDDNAQNLQHFLKQLKNVDYRNIDLEEYLSYDDLKFYNELLDVAEKSDSQLMSQFSTFMVPSLKSLMNMTFHILNLRDNRDKLSTEDKEFVNRLHNIIVSEEPYAQDLKNPDLLSKFVKYTTNPEEIQELKRNPELKNLVIFNKQKLVGYKQSEPIFIKNTDGKIYPIDQIPGRDFKISTEPEYIEVAYVFLPLWQELPNPPPLPATLQTPASSLLNFNNKKSPNMSPVQLGHDIRTYFSERKMIYFSSSVVNFS